MDENNILRKAEERKAIMEGKLDREKLVKVVGGSTHEMDELKAVVFGNPRLKAMWDEYYAELDSEMEATACTVADAINLGFTASMGDDPNIYDDYNHEIVLRLLKNY